MTILKSIIIALSLYCSSYAHAFDVYDDYLSLMGFKLEETNLYKIKEKLGDVPIIYTVGTAGAYFSVCYTSMNNDRTVYFESEELGGKKHRLLSFMVKNTVEKLEKCGRLSVHEADLNVGVIKLGSNINNIVNLLPQPVENVEGYGVLHKHYRKLPFSKEDIERTQVENMEHAFWSVLIFIEVFEKQGIVNGYKVSKFTSW